MPDTLVLIFFIGLLATAITYVVPAGMFETQDISYIADGAEKTRTVLDPESFAYATDEQGELVYNSVGLFASGGGIGLMNFVFEGLVSGSKWGSAIGVIMFMLVIGGAFGIVIRPVYAQVLLKAGRDLTTGLKAAVEARAAES